MSLDLKKQLDLSKQNVLDLKKRKGIDGQKAQVVLAIDYSGSMQRLYESGYVQRVVQRLVPVAMAFDDNESLEVFKFDSGVHRVEIDCTPSNVSGYVKDHVYRGRLGGTNYAPAIREIVKEHVGNATATQTAPVAKKTLFGAIKSLISGKSNSEPDLNAKSTSDLPTYVIFITDGENFDPAETKQAMIEASKHGVFFQFVGICDSARTRFPQLEALDNMSGRLIDNANFFKLSNAELVNNSDTDIYNLLLAEFPDWLKLAKSNNLIK